MHKKSLKNPDKTMTPPKSKSEIVEVDGKTIIRHTFAPGWKWSECIGPMAGTKSCHMHHFGVILSGRMAVKMDDGTEFEGGPDDVANIPPGHDAWVVGDEPAVMIDFTGGK